MKDGYKRLLIVIITMLSALLIVIGIGKLLPDSSYTLYQFLKGKKPPSSEKISLAKAPPVSPEDVPISIQLSMENAAVSRAVMPSVVSIGTSGSSKTQSEYGQLANKQTLGQGSGVIVSEQGHIITNQHVIAGKQQIYATLYNGAQFEAILIGFDPSTDIAVLKIECPYPLIPLKFGDSDKVREGHLVMAFGNPYGIGKSVTNGIVSARKTSRSDRQTSLFQTNVAINPGNSGGPLVNVIGEIVGINSSIFSTDKNNPGFQGISFAIPSNIVKKTFLDILKFKRPMRGYLGIYAEGLLSPNIRSKLKFYEEGGVLVSIVEKKSPAALAGIEAQDIIIKYGGKSVSNKSELMQMIHASPVNEKIDVTVWRGEREKLISVKLDQIDVGIDYLKQRQYSKEVERSIIRAIGISARSLGPEYEINGVRITAIAAKSLADGRLFKNDIIFRVNSRPVYHANHFRQLLLAIAPKKKLTLVVIRQNQLTTLEIQLPQLNKW